MEDQTNIEFRTFWTNGENTYQISENGIVRSLKRGIERILNPYSHRSGERYIRISTKDGLKTFSIKRLIASQFLNKSEDQTVVIYLDHNQQNCVASNLKWATSQESFNHRKSRKRQQTPAITRTDVKMEVDDFDRFTDALLSILSSTPNNSSSSALIHLN